MITYQHASVQLLDHASFAVMFVAYIMAIYHECHARAARAWGRELAESDSPSVTSPRYQAAMAAYPYHEADWAGTALMMVALRRTALLTQWGGQSWSGT